MSALAQLGLASVRGDAAGARKAVVEDGADVNAAAFNYLNGKMGGTCTAATMCPFSSAHRATRPLQLYPSLAASMRP